MSLLNDMRMRSIHSAVTEFTSWDNFQEYVNHHMFDDIKQTEELKAIIKDLESKYDDCRGYLATSVCKECKCETNTRVNHDTVSRNLELRAIIRDFMTTKEDLRTWRDEMQATISEVLGEE